MNRLKAAFRDKKLVYIILVVYFLAYAIDFSSILLVRFTTDSWSGAETGADFDAGNLALKYIFTYTLKLLFLLLAIYIAIGVLSIKKLSLKGLVIHALLAFSLSIYTAAVALLLNKHVFGEITTISLESVWVRGVNALSFNFFVYVAILAIVYAYHYLQDQKAVALKQEQLKTQLLDSKINALQSQLQPHFLFNALNDISSLMDIDVEKSQNAIADLSLLLRNTLRIKDEKFIPLSRELEILNHYIDIERIRFGDKLEVNLDIQRELSNSLVPPLLLQPFLENAIKHGFSYDYDKLMIELSARRVEGRLLFEVQNNGTPLIDGDTVVYGDGITNVLERLDNLYDRDYDFEMKNKEEEGVQFVSVFIDIPL